jgi:tetratricopeptide (TPR) repeat protein
MTNLLRKRLTILVIGPLLFLTLGRWPISYEPRPLAARDNPTQLAPQQTANPATAAKPAIPLEERADIFMARKSYADAVDYYYRALQQPGLSKRDSATVWNKLGIAFQQEVNYGAARKAYQEAIRRRPDFGEPWNNLGTTYFMDNRIKKSVKYYAQSVKLYPNSSSFHMNLGTAYYRLKKFKEAVGEYQTALTLNPNILSDRSPLGTVMQTRGTDADFYFYLAKSLALVGRADEAVRYLRRAFEDGFRDHKRLAEDPDFQKISQNPNYLELMKNPPVPIRE